MGAAGNPKTCRTCSRPYTKIKGRSGECFACYLRHRRGHDLDASCACCAHADRRVLRRHVLLEGRVTLCANCAAVAGRRAIGLDELRLELHPPGDRRQADRRAGDRRGPVERRQRVEVELLLSDADRRAVGGRRAGERVDAAAE